MRKVFYIVFFACLLLFTNAAIAQLAATIKADSSKIEIGDLLHLHLIVNADSQLQNIKIPVFNDSIGDMEIVSKTAPKTQLQNDRKIIVQDFTVSAYDKGDFYIPPIAISYYNKTVLDTVFTNDLLIYVTTLKVDTTKPIKPIKPELPVPYILSEFYGWIAMIASLLALIILVVFLYYKFRKKHDQKPSRPKPKEPAHIWAQRQLHILQEQRLWQKGDIKTYYSKLSEILRLYLEYSYDYYAIEATTEEIKEKLPILDIDAVSAKDLIAVLQLADLAKFAKMNPTPEQNETALAKAKKFVKNTIPIEKENKAEKEKNAN